MVKKGQAAMEYLMTYGWAILVIVIVLAALLYLGVFNVGSRTPEQCNFQVGILCTSAKVTTTTTSLTLRNGLGQRMNVCSILCDDTRRTSGADYLTTIATEGGTVLSCTSPPVDAIGSNAVDVGEEKTLQQANGGCIDSSTTPATVAVGGKYRGKVYITYYLAGDTSGDSLRVAEGDLQTTIQVG
ncbi:Uncharacterised protein [Candidatus Burarchaeum australiense]|nr:Uncharacterised protein [Candidatus Burarchaeum australiense]